MRYQGRITRWSDEREFGFITPNGSRNLVFVHIKAFANRPQRPVMNELVNYELSDDPVGRAQAENVTLVSDDPEVAGSSFRWRVSIAAAGLILFFIAASALGVIFLKGHG
ncbi:MAG: cold shock domain-containing protein [Desulfobacteraceae bacterium]|nr:cold shock domain-containing protein [Desulfobacteraceae bacterium]